MSTSGRVEPLLLAADDFDLGPPTRVRYRVLAAACGLAVLTYLHRVGFATASAAFQKPLGLDDRQMGTLMAAFLAAYGLFEIPWGWLGDRFGVRNLLPVIALGGALLTGCVALIGFLPPRSVWVFATLLGLRFLLGMFQAGTFPALSRMLADWMPVTERGSAQGFVWMSSRIGGAVAPTLLVGLFAAFGDWRAPLVLVASLGAVWCLLFRPWFRNRPEQMPAVNAAERKLIAAGRVAGQGGSAHLPWRQLLRSGNVWALCVMYGCLGFSGNFFLTLLPTYLRNHRALGATATGLLSSVPFACGVVACLAGGLLSDALIRRHGDRRWGRRLVGLLGMSLAALAILGTVWAVHPILLGVLLGLTFFGNDFTMGPSWAAAAEIGGRHTGSLSGAMNMFANVGGAGAMFATGHLFHAGHDVLPFAVFSAVYALGALCWLRIDATQPLADPESNSNAL